MAQFSAKRASDVIQVLVAEAADDSTGGILTRLLRSLEQQGRRYQIWMPEQARLQATSPWAPLLDEDRLQTRVHPMPSLILISTAADWQALHRFYGSSSRTPVLQLLFGADLTDWGHGGSRRAAIRVCHGPEIAAVLEHQGHLREPLQILPIGLDSAELPPVPNQRSLKRVLILARHRPDLGLLLQQRLEQQGLDCRCELEPWPITRWQQAIASASTVVNLAPQQEGRSLGLRRLSAMALQTALVSEERAGLDSLCRDGRNALVRPGDPRQLCEAVLSLHGQGGLQLRRQLVEGGLATALRQRSARQELEFLNVLDQVPRLWDEARSCHPENNLFGTAARPA